VDPTDPQTYSFRALTRQRVGDYNGAIADYTKIIEMVPSAAFAYKSRGVLFLLLKRDAEAERDLRKYVQLMPNERLMIEDLISRAKANRK
jgi:lipoprotein NlpI